MILEGGKNSKKKKGTIKSKENVRIKQSKMKKNKQIE